MKIEKTNLLECIGLIMYKVCLELSYTFLICKVYGYYTHYKVEFELLRYLESWFLFCCLIAITPRRKKITSYYLVVQLVVIVIPMLVVYGLYSWPIQFICLVCFSHALQCIMDRVINFKICNRFSIKYGKVINGMFIIAITLISIALTIVLFGIPDLRAFNFSKVYEVRAENRLSGFGGYVVPIYFTVVLPLITISGLKKKKKLQIIFFFVIAIFLYLSYAHKSWFFSIILNVIVYFALKKKMFIKACCIGMPLMVAFGSFCYMVSDKLVRALQLLVCRLLITPAILEFEYYTFFEKRGKMYFVEGRLGRIFGIEPMFDREITYIIGDQAGMHGASANTGYFASAYANLGSIGVILFAIILFFILKSLDMILNEEDFNENFATLFFVLFSLSNSGLLTRLLTGGLAFLYIILIMERGRNNMPRINST